MGDAEELGRRGGAARWRPALEWAMRLHERYRRVFWTLHSVWALLTGVAVLVLAHNRYGYLPWVVLFIALTWASTLFFSRLAGPGRSAAFRFAQGFVSYFTRVLYQETLFFLIPFYFYSTTFPSWNCAYVILLGILAVLSCYDLLFDHLLRTRRVFAMAYFAVVSFSALQFFLPAVFRIRIHNGAYLAAGVAFVAAVSLAYSPSELRHPRRLAKVLLALVLVMAGVRFGRPAVPPVPLRLIKVRFATAFDPGTMRAPREYESEMPLDALADHRLYAIATIFAPSRIPTSLTFRFVHDGKVLRSSHTVDVLAHERGFRVWDTLRPPAGGFRPGRYRVEVWTREGQLVGRAEVALVAPGSARTAGGAFP